MGLVAKRFEVFLVNLDPTVGSEIQKMRPCVVISPKHTIRGKLRALALRGKRTAVSTALFFLISD